MDNPFPALPPAIRLLGLAGAPGVGKSTVAAALAAEHGLAVVPMDGFHYADVELARRGLLDRKGAPETFDAEGYAALLRRVRGREPSVVAPSFDRDLEQPLAGAIAVPAAGTVVTEGNYLLLDEPRWHAVRAQLDEVWHLHVDDDLRQERLVARHVRHGKTSEEAQAWVARVDEPNARLVDAAARRADRVVDLTGWAAYPAPPAG
ncbi:nucleoside/nucleotide kinase family protein [Nocardioides sp. SOB77]|uniref:Nucleoside/nucleotide kinase family protein n=1 Tax=Nocardioides oceani TaxID=3058369 RepID=A0ABT8FA49_9ACTN|nr:nucleoside/nucleotide kinase family protein [Nocardioides oceani]MDN4171558.1 nucleoside/nucleotide kinase family protein [Nocardioides oceani]